MGRRGSVNSDFWWAAEASERPRNSFAGASPWSPMASHRGTARDRLEEKAVESQNPSRAGEPQGGAQRHDSSSRAATGPRPGKESRSDLPKQPCLSTQSIRRDARDTADNSSNARDPTPGDRRERRSGISMSSKRARPKQVSEATGGRGEGRETWRREDGRERNRRTEMQKSRRKTFSLLSSLLESLFAVCTRALSLSRTRTGCCCFSVATTTGTGSGKGREKKGLSNFGGGVAGD